MATIKEKLQLSASDVMRDLECVICMEVPTAAPVYQCGEGHILCKDCYPDRKDLGCPTCNGSLVPEIRCRMAEMLLSKLPSRCKYNEPLPGCDVELLSADLVRHEEQCLYRPIACLDLQCKEEVKIIDFSKHVQEHISVIEQPLNAISIKLPEYERNKALVQCPSVYFKVNEDEFYMVMVREGRKFWYLWVCAASSLVTEKYRYKLEMKSEDHKEKYEYMGECSSLDRYPIKTMIREDFCDGLILNDTIIEKFKWEGNNLRMKVKIFRSDVSSTEIEKLATDNVETQFGSTIETSQTESDSPESDSKERKGKKLKRIKRSNGKNVRKKLRTKRKSEPKQFYLSNDLARIVGKNKATRECAVQQMWAYIRKNNLQDPTNKQFAICDVKLRDVIGKKRFKCMYMKRYLDAHIFSTYQMEPENFTEQGGETTTKEGIGKSSQLRPIKIRPNKDLFDDISRARVTADNLQSDFIPFGKALWCEPDELAIIEEIRLLCEQEEILKRKTAQDSQIKVKINTKATPMSMNRST